MKKINKSFSFLDVFIETTFISFIFRLQLTIAKPTTKQNKTIFHVIASIMFKILERDDFFYLERFPHLLILRAFPFSVPVTQ